MSLLPYSSTLRRSNSFHDLALRRPILDYGINGFNSSFHDFHNRFDDFHRSRFYDPFDELDLVSGNDLQWLHRPSFIRTYVTPRQPEKYRVTVNCQGYNPNTIKTEVIDKKVYVYAREESRVDSNNYTLKEFKKSYDLPENSDTDKLHSYVVSKDQLVIEVPLHQEKVVARELYLHPVVSDDKKYVSMEFAFPEYIDPSKISVVCKNNDLIIRGEDTRGTWDKQSHFSYYKRVTLPENTDFYELKCKMDSNVLAITAPLYDSDFRKNNNLCRSIPYYQPNNLYCASSSSASSHKALESSTTSSSRI